MVLNATVVANTEQWKQYSPQDFLILDKLVIPPGMAMDSLLLQVDMQSEEYYMTLQNLRAGPDDHLAEKTHTVRKPSDLGKTPDPKDKGYTLAATPHAEKKSTLQDLADKLLSGEGLKDAKVLDVADLNADQIKEMFDKLIPEGPKVDVLKILVLHPKSWRTMLSQLTSVERRAEVRIHNFNVLVYFALDYLAFAEYGQYVQKDSFYYEKVFSKARDAKSSEVEETAQAIKKAFEEFPLEDAKALRLARFMIQYAEQREQDRKLRAQRAKSGQVWDQKKYEEVSGYQAKDLAYLGKA